MSEDRYERDHKSPTQWRNRAHDLRAAAAAIDFANRTSRGADVVAHYELGASFDMQVATRRVVWMLYGMSLECLMKAVIVARAQKVPKTHNLRRIAKAVELNLTESQLGVLDVLTHAIIWFGRYPTPTAENRGDVESMATAFSKVAMSPVPSAPMFTRWNGAMDWKALEEIWNATSDLGDG